jgi:hypothetical protein
MKDSSYPTISLDKAIDAVRTIKDKLGPGPFGRSILLEVLGYSQKSGRGNNVLSSLSQYGLIYRKEKQYYLTDLSVELFFSDGVPKTQSAVEAFLSTSIFYSLFKEYKNSLPRDSWKRLAKEYGIPESKIELVLRNYIDSLQFISTGTRESNQQAERVEFVTNLLLDKPRLLPSPKPVGEEDSVTVNFGNGFIASVPKRVILQAYLEELKKLQDEYTALLHKDMPTSSIKFTGNADSVPTGSIKVDPFVSWNTLYRGSGLDDPDYYANIIRHMTFDEKKKGNDTPRQ